MRKSRGSSCVVYSNRSGTIDQIACALGYVELFFISIAIIGAIVGAVSARQA